MSQATTCAPLAVKDGAFLPLPQPTSATTDPGPHRASQKAATLGQAL